MSKATTTRPARILYTAAEVASMLSLSEQYIRDQAKLGRVPHHVFGGRYRFSMADVDQILLQSRRAAPAAVEVNPSVPRRPMPVGRRRAG